MRTVSKRVASAVLALVGVCAVSASASAAPADAGATWSLGVFVSQVTQASDNEVYVAFSNADGSVRKLWPNAAGADVCNGAGQLRLSRTRANFDGIVQVLTTAGLSGRAVHVWYEPYQGSCYIKGAGIYIK